MNVQRALHASAKLVAASLWIILPATASLAQQADSTVRLPAFAVASIRPNNSPTDQFRLRFTPDGVSIHNASLLMVLRAAYGMFNSLDDKFIGVPAWAKTQRFNIEAKVDPTDAPTFKTLSFDQRQRIVQALLADRFKLQTHLESRQQAVYTLIVAKNGPKLSQARPSEEDKDISVTRSSGSIIGTNAVVPQLVSALTQALGRTVQDESGLGGKYDFALRWTPEQENETAQSTGESIFTALQEQLGLKLESTHAAVECLVVDHLEQPSEN